MHCRLTVEGDLWWHIYVILTSTTAYFHVHYKTSCKTYIKYTYRIKCATSTYKTS